MYRIIANNTAIFVYMYYEIICIYFNVMDFQPFLWLLNNLKFMRFILSTVSTVAFVPKHQAIS